MKTYKKIMAVLMCSVMILGMIATDNEGFLRIVEDLSVKAHAVSADDLVYTINNGEVTITGCNENISGELIIPDLIEGCPVTIIGKQAFQSRKNITKVQIPNSIETIGYEAFCGCTGISEILIPNGVLNLETFAFGDCSNLSKISLPDSITNVGEWVFYNTAFYKDESNWDNDVLYIDKCLIEAKDSLSGSYSIKPETICVSGYAFKNSANLTNIIFPDSVKYLCLYAFENCTGLTNIIIGKGVKCIGGGCFRSCTNLVNITLPDGLISIEYQAFDSCISLESIHIPNSVTFLGDWVFGYCYRLKDVTLSKSLTRLNGYTFKGCNNLNSITIPEGVTRIDSGEFDSCDNLESIFIPRSVNSIRRSAFDYCEKITDIYYSGSETEWKAIERVGSELHTSFFDATVHYNSSGFDVSEEPDISHSVTISFSKDLYDYKIGEEFAISGELYSPNGTNGISLDWTVSDANGLSLNLPASMQNTDANHIIFSALATGSEEGKYTITVTTSNGASDTTNINVFKENNAELDGTTITFNENEYYCCIGDTVTLSGGIYSPNGLTEIALDWEIPELEGVTVKNTSFSRIDANHISFSVSATGNKEGTYKIIAKLSDGTSESTRLIVKKYEVIYEDKVLGRDEIITTEHPLDYYIENGQSTKYDSELSLLLAGFSDNAYNLYRLNYSLTSHGFELLRSENYDINPNDNWLVAYSISTKRLSNGDLIALICIRGTASSLTGAEWQTNLGMGPDKFFTKGNHYEFNKCADEVLSSVYSCVGVNNKIKYVVTGHSKGAAVANLLTVKLDELGIPQSNVFNYNFACPDVAIMNWDRVASHNNIFNICDVADPITHLPGSLGDSCRNPVSTYLYNETWGKYGITRWFQRDANDSSIDICFLSDNFAHNINMYIYFLKLVKNKELEFEKWLSKADLLLRECLNTATAITIRCPVDVKIFDASGNMLAQITNNEVSYSYTDKPIFVFTDEGEKSIIMLGDETLAFSIVGTDSGKMNIFSSKVDVFSGTVKNQTIIENVIISKGKTLSCTTKDSQDLSNLKLFVLNEENKRIAEVQPNGTEVPIESTFNPTASAKLKLPSSTEVEYASTVTVKAKATGVPESYYIALYDGKTLLAKGSNTEVSYTVPGEFTSSKTLTVKIIDNGEKVQKDGNGKDLSASFEVKAKSGFFARLIAFFKRLFNALPAVEVKPNP